MKSVSIAFALVLSFFASLATVPFAMPPLATGDGGQMRRAAENCRGYEDLYLLLRSARAAEDFRRNGRCTKRVMRMEGTSRRDSRPSTPTREGTRHLSIRAH